MAAILNLADIWPARRFFAASALLAALANALLLVAPSYAVALGLRFATGAALAGVYPPAMKMVATWFHERRGMAIGIIVGALTLGKATPYLVHAMPAATSRPWFWRRRSAPVLQRRSSPSDIMTGRMPSSDVLSPGLSCEPSSRNANGAWPRVAISVTCGSCTASGRGSPHFSSRAQR